MSKILMLVLLVLLLNSAARAQAVYKCEVKGKSVYQDSPCAVARETGAVKLTYTPATPEDVAKAQTNSKIIQAKRRQEELAQELAQQQEMAMQAGRVAIGMTGQQAIRAWGEPKKINRTMTAGHTREQWVYGNGNYVYVDNGVVTALQN